MSIVRKCSLIQIIFCLAVLCYLLISDKKHLQYSVFYFPLAVFILISMTHKKLHNLSSFLKANYYEVYKKRINPRKFLLDDVNPVNVFSFKKEELNTISNKQAVELITDLKVAYKICFASLAITLLFLIVKSVL